MAVNGATIEVIGPGIEEGSAENGSYVQNMHYHDNSWKVRKGFGQLGEWDSSLSAFVYPIRGNSEGEGYREILGSTVMQTNFGHTQIITVMSAISQMANGYHSPTKTPAPRLRIFIAHIYDVTTDDHWEELLVESSGMHDTDMPLMKGYFNSLSPQKVVVNTDLDLDQNLVNFVEFADILYFGSPELGAWYYKPAAFKGNRGKALEQHKARRVYGDNTLISPLILVPNTTYSAEYNYFERLPEPPITLATLGNRIVYVGEHSITFSDPIKPQSVIVDNIIEVPSSQPLTAAIELNGNLLVFSSEETFMFQPSANLIVGGRLTKISDSIGCDHANLVTKLQNTAVFVDKNGVHMNSGALEISTISTKIDSFFKSFLSNPLNRYLVENGDTSATAPQPSLTHHYDSVGSSLLYHEAFKALLLTVNDHDRGKSISLCYSLENQSWSLWSYESAAYNEGNVAKVGVREEMKCTMLVGDGTRLWSVGIDPNNTITDSAQKWNGAAWIVSPNQSQTMRSLVISEYGKGGAIDRSSANEDYRYGIGEWTPPYISAGGYAGNHVTTTNPDLIFGEPILVKPGYILDGQTWSHGGAMVPVSYNLGSTLNGLNYINPVYHYEIGFQYDAQNWTIQQVASGGFNRINGVFVEGMERFRGGYGFDTAGFPQILNSNEMQEMANGAVKITWDAHINAAGTSVPYEHFWSQYDFVNNALPAYVSPLPNAGATNQVLFWLPFIKLNALSTSTVNIESVNAAFYTDKFQAGAIVGANDFYLTENYVFRWSSLAANRNVNDVKAQAVDWCYLSAPKTADEQKQSKARGLFTNLSSTGTSTEPITNGWGTAVWNPRVFNSSVSSDYRRYNTQIIDYTGDPQGVAESDFAKVQPSIRTRVKNTTTAMGYKVFEDADNTWNNNVLTDDQQFGELSTSNTTKGRTFTWLLWGHMLNKAEALVIKTAKAVARTIGSRRRKGH